ncbi:Transmembrane domain-containing protein [Spironucleus salmonicida]|uniref:Transmembrane domain-containing protein n=1 Tax=Spironucleus salmonicida TaxID=348837 RepID=V6LRI2_9EUKA|nr:Transmembrane domain-containing protein [Spironucleus salmonicida]|eukprot:EST46306.1 Transmembrane domain-containing protein [Spironucleus salmonicida]
MSHPVYTRVTLMIPSLDRVGAFPCMIILSTSLLIYVLALQDWFPAFEYLFNDQAQMPPSAITAITIMSLPCSLLFLFIVGQIRQRRNLKFFNFGSILHFITFLLSFFSGILYFITHLEESFHYLQILIGSVDQINQLQEVLKTLLNNNFVKNLQSNSTLNTILLYCGGYSFLLQFFVAMIVATFSCSKFGERKLVVYIRDSDFKYTVVVENSAIKKQMKLLRKEKGKN